MTAYLVELKSVGYFNLLWLSAETSQAEIVFNTGVPYDSWAMSFALLLKSIYSAKFIGTCTHKDGIYKNTFYSNYVSKTVTSKAVWQNLLLTKLPWKFRCLES